MATKRTPTKKQPSAHTRRRSPEAQEQFKQEIVGLARRIYEEHGYDGLSIRSVTEPFGVTQMTFYAYFPSKAALVLHLWNEVLEELCRLLEAAGEGKSTPRDVFRAHMEAYLRYWDDHPEQYRMFMVQAAAQATREDQDFTLAPAYERLRQLHGKRVLDCVGARPKAVATRLAEIAYMKATGYLHTTLGLRRYPFKDPSTLRKSIVDDIVAGVMAGAG